MSKAFKEAIQAGRAILKGKWQDSNVKMDRQFGITEIKCPGCGVVIARLMPIGPQKISRHKQQTIVQEGMLLGKIANYREVLFEMTDGSKHVTNVCVDCAKDAEDPATAVALYAQNLSQFSAEGHVLSDRMCDRGPVRVLKVADSIKE